MRPLAQGWDNTVLLVGDVLFRFPRREIALDGLRRELAVLPRVAPVLPLAVPVPTHLGRPAGNYPWPFWGAAPVPGHDLAGLAETDRVPAAEAVGEFLRVLHGIRVDVDLPVDPMARADPSARAPLARDWLDKLALRGLWSGSREVDELLATPLRAPTGEPVLVHGDLHLRHLLVDDAGRATGVIDWGDTCLADPAVDLSIGYAAFSGRGRDRFLATYGPVDPDREVRARVLAVCLCAALAEHAAEVGEQQLLTECLRGIRRAAS